MPVYLTDNTILKVIVDKDNTVVLNPIPPISTFVTLTDTPANYTGAGGNFVKVTIGEDGLEFGAGAVPTNFTDLNDTPNAYTGDAGKIVVVNTGETGLEFLTVAGVGDMTKAVYDPTNIQLSAFDYNNFINTPPLLSSTTDLAEGTNLYYTEGRVSLNSDVVANTAKISYTDATAVGLNTAKISADGSINNHLDVDIVTDAVTEGEVMVWRTNKFVPEQQSGGGGAVSSVFGRSGVVIAVSGDYNTSLVTENTNLYYTEGRVAANAAVALNTAKISYTDAAAVAANTAKVTNATHTGDVTGDTALTIAADVVGANELDVTGNGTITQYLRSDADGTFTWDTPAGGGGAQPDASLDIIFAARVNNAGSGIQVFYNDPAYNLSVDGNGQLLKNGVSIPLWTCIVELTAYYSSSTYEVVTAYVNSAVTTQTQCKLGLQQTSNNNHTLIPFEGQMIVRKGTLTPI